QDLGVEVCAGIEHHLGLGQQTRRPHREQVGGAGTGADEVNRHRTYLGVQTPAGETRVLEEPTISRHFISMEAGSSSPRVVSVNDSSARPTSRPTTTTVSGRRCSSSTL